MYCNRSLIPCLAIDIASVVALNGCTKVDEGKGPVASIAGSASGKIPVTTSSDEARKEFLQGRELAV
jgi:hypothetical protein